MAIWVLVTPLYDRLIAVGAEAVLRAFEDPKVTRLRPGRTHVTVDRSDFDPRSPRPDLPVYDLTFNWVLFTALCAVNVRPLSDRKLLHFALGSAVMAVTHVLALVSEVMSLYVLRLGPWSRAHYGPVARNLWTAASHSYRLVLMFAIAFALWWALRLADEPAAHPPSPRAARRRTRPSSRGRAV
jgi:hypothetical protein